MGSHSPMTPQTPHRRSSKTGTQQPQQGRPPLRILLARPCSPPGTNDTANDRTDRWDGSVTRCGRRRLDADRDVNGCSAHARGTGSAGPVSGRSRVDSSWKHPDRGKPKALGGTGDPKPLGAVGVPAASSAFPVMMLSPSHRQRAAVIPEPGGLKLFLCRRCPCPFTAPVWNQHGSMGGAWAQPVLRGMAPRLSELTRHTRHVHSSFEASPGNKSLQGHSMDPHPRHLTHPLFHAMHA